MKIVEILFYKQKTAYDIYDGLVGSEMCIRDRDTDDPSYGGFGRNDRKTLHVTLPQRGTNVLFLYLPARTAMVLIED